MKIGEVANETGLSISNIRFYEKKGLLAPARKEESGYRDYTKEDIYRLKTILLYRKMNLPIETIYLLFQEKIGLEDALQRHKQELEKQKEELESSLGLCQKVLSDRDFTEIDVDNYLEYVHEEESKGRQFIVIQEIVDDFSEYIGFKRYVYGDPVIGHILGKPWVMRMISAIWLIVCLSLPIIQLWESYSNYGTITTNTILYILIWGGIVLFPFFKYFIWDKRRGDK